MEKQIKRVFLQILLLTLGNVYICATPLPLGALLKVCENPTPANVTRVVRNYGWQRDSGRFANGTFGPRWISTRDNMNMNVKATSNGTLIKLRYRLLANSYAANDLASSLSDYGFSCINKYIDSNGESHMIFTNRSYSLEVVIWDNDGQAYYEVEISLR